ncbi:MAG: protein translocase subunit SecDF [Bacteroidia bacterium]|nr:protein translocase subunit SecDF [Bacteroidia bacterium]
MRQKNTVIFLLAIFTAICGYNLYWTYVQFSSDNKLKSVSEPYNQLMTTKPDRATWTAEDSALENQYNDLMGDKDFQDNYKKATERSFTLGLDLQGGMFVTLEVSVDEILRQQASNPNDTSLLRALECARQKAGQESRSFVGIFVDCYKQRYPNGSLGALFSSEDKEISVGTSDADVARILESDAESAIDRTFEIIRTRIDQFGVVSPNLQKQPGTGRILLELPGVKEPERVRKLLSSTAKLEFYTTYSWRDAYPVLTNINNRLKQLESLKGITAAPDSAAQDSTTTPAPPDSTAVAAAGDSAATDSADEIPFDQLSPAEQEARRAEFRRENPLFALLSPANYDYFNQNNSETPLVGAALAKDTAEINKLLAREDIKALIPPKMRFAWTFKPIEEGSDYFQLLALFDDGSPVLTGKEVAIARQDFDPSNNQPVVSMRMNQEGTAEWARITEANVNKHVAVLLDGFVYSFPVVNEPIRGGSSQIAGGFDIDEAKDLANVLRAGQLDVTARIAGEETVGPTLGAENISRGAWSFIIALIVVMIYMGVYYGRSGLIADLALVGTMIFVLGCSAAFTVVLTLPGIAAIVLTIGMAVDANVLIFERIREEMRGGKTLKAAIKAGYEHAFSSVMDSNITTFLTGVVLYSFGVGPIRGFAVALMIGIVASLISALIITRLILEYYANRGSGSLNFGFTWTVGAFDNIKLMMSKRKRGFYIFSGALTLISLISIFTVGFKTGVDLKGGRQFIVEFTTPEGQPAPLDNDKIEGMRRSLTQVFENNAPVIKTLRSDHQIMVTTSYKLEDRAATDEVGAKMLTGMDNTLPGVSKKILSTSDVGPTVASDIRDAAIQSVIFSLLMIFLYILVRFRRWQLSLGALASLFHDVLIVLGVFSVLSLVNMPFSVEIDQAMIAALLTIIGYSINDTVVVFDRIRERMNEDKTITTRQAFDTAIDETISRTIVTSLTTLLAALVLFFVAGDVIRGFVFAIIVGIGFGTYSSIFVASAIALDLIEREEKGKGAAAAAPAKPATT